MIGIGLVLLTQVSAPLAVRVDAVRPHQHVIHYDIAVSIPDAGQVIRARTALRFTLSSAAPLRLDFDTAFTVDSVLLGDRPGQMTVVPRLQWSLAHDGELTVRPGARADTLDVAIVYHGAPTDGLFIKDNVHGVRSAFADNWPNRAHHWFPCYDHPSDKATATLSIDVPAGWKAVGNGRLMSVDTLAGGRTRWHWNEERRIPVYTIVLGAGRLAVTPIPDPDGPPQSVWAFPEDSAFAVTGPFRRAGEIVEAFTRLFGPFPYEKLAHVESSTRFGGMENSSAIFYDERKYADRTMKEGVVAHETAHQWFGDGVTEADWHHLWLSEGFASYLEPLFYEAMGDTAAFRAHMAEERRAYLASSDVERPVIDTAQHDLFRLLNRNNYEKGAWILHMLRREIGDSAFFRGLATYERQFRDSVALTSDFASVMERAAGRSLQTFFREWLLQPGYPKLRIVTRCTDGRLGMTAEQVQPEDWGLWTLDLPATIGGHRTMLAVSGAVTTLTYPSCGDVTLDPERDYLVDWTLVQR